MCLSKRIYMILFFLLVFLLVGSGCSAEENTGDQPTITKNPDSEYEQTFSDLNLGVLFHFDFYLPQADNRWVDIWVEKYSDGKMKAEPLIQLSYGHSPDSVQEGRLGFGMINHDTQTPLLFLFAPGMSTEPEVIDKQSDTETITWNYTIGEEKTELELGEEITLAAYREKEGSSIRTEDFQDEESINRIIEEGDMVMLLKLKVTEESPEQ
ncbi:hypothetical protein F9U64_06280 [Gracilibacillus oryzae]|uniref:Lipoprotein n=1 Tax=Gracilibacillus oryzae TaxID=1672701 RepID=A0A7C8KRI2_9BACI|nr:hypothetical protein [Gracilibacillus oryzae]KAB8138146.1 hypothetical protein F9U64_06280 [Gracilibacillus oryzae]